MKNTQTSVRVDELDSLRGIAAMAVVCYHFTVAYDNGHQNILEFQPFRYGYLGVQLFFMISGFVILMTLERSKNLLSFAISRFSRLYPLYWCSILLTLIFLAFAGAPDQQKTFPLSQVLANFTMIQGYLKIKDIDVPYWTLGIELVFYVIMGFIFFLKLNEKIYKVSSVWLVLSLFAPLYLIFPVQKIINVLFILRYAPFFIAGILFYRAKKDGPSRLNHILIACSLLCNIYLLFLLPVTEPNTGFFIPVVLYLLFYGAFYLMLYDKLKFIKQKPIIFLGTISYPLYLIHNAIGVGLISHIRQVADSKWIYLPVVLFVVISLAYLMHILLETPLQKTTKNLLTKWLTPKSKSLEIAP